MNVILQILVLAAGFVLLVKGSDYFVDGSAGLAARFGIPQLVIGLTVVAMGTSAPEAAVSITAAFRDNADICVGNIVGSNILNVLIILGIASVIVPIRVADSTIRYEIPYMIGCSILLVFLGYDQTVDRLDGGILLAAFVAYLTYLFVCARKNKCEEQPVHQTGLPKQLGCILGGMAAIILGSKLAVYAATNIAIDNDIDTIDANNKSQDDKFDLNEILAERMNSNTENASLNDIVESTKKTTRSRRKL